MPLEDSIETSSTSREEPSSSTTEPSLGRQRLGSLRNRTMKDSPQHTHNRVPHRGALCRLVSDDGLDASYVIDILVENGSHQLHYTRRDFEFAQRLFAILDTESRGLVDRATVKEFVTLRCPVLWRRDEDLRRLQTNSESDSDSPTLDEVWKAVAVCSRTTQLSDNLTDDSGDDEDLLNDLELGVEGWMVVCRFIALAQYLEAKRRFSARHLQQTMRHRNSPRGSEVVVVDVPPPEPPAPLSPQQLAQYEQHQSKAPLPLPELDLDHSLLAAHDVSRKRPTAAGCGEGTVKISLFGASSSFSPRLLLNSTGSSTSAPSYGGLEFAVTYTKPSSEQVVVRRSMADMKWLNDTFASHKVLGGTLCGRILPPFPGSSGSGVLSSHFPSSGEDSMLNTSIKSTNGAIAAAAAGVGRIRSAAKSFFVGTPLAPESSPGTAASGPKKVHHKPAVSLAIPESYYNPNSPAGKARQLERYLNYLLEHPALSTSFPLNTILKASQSGLEAAKQSLEEYTKASNEIRQQTPHLDDGKLSIPFWPSSASGASPNSPNFAWVRTAAQAAVALKLHGMLETTGMPSASARLQHASLPSFGPARKSGWEDHETELEARGIAIENSGGGDEASIGTRETNNFEDGVQHVQSELRSEDEVLEQQNDDGYDLLPLPVPAPERLILSAGSDIQSSVDNMDRESRFYYGSAGPQGQYPLEVEEDSRSAFLGDIAVDDNIDKLREVIGSMDNTLSRCLASSGGIGKAQRERQALHLDVVRGLDSWEGMRGKFVSQRALLKGVAGVDQSKEIYEESDLALIDDISWQTSLANSAVTAAEEVRSAVRASRTAANAKAAASSAAFAAQNACDTGEFANIDEARAAQTRASMAQSHAIYAAVVDHEAKTVKRRATLALAHDVKSWNVHRKREMLRACLDYARSQHEATRRAVDAWSCLRDGFIGTTVIPSAQEPRATAAPPVTQPETHRQAVVTDPDEVTATIYEELTLGSSPTGEPSIVAIDHRVLATAAEGNEDPDDVQDTSDEPTKSADSLDAGLILPFATAAPISEEDEDTKTDRLGSSSSLNETKADKSNSEEVLSASMQSLVNGLMNWGGGFDAEEDHFALPVGMAASIALEESAAMGSKIA